MRLACLVAFVCLLAPSHLWAKQTKFKRTDLGKQVQFEYEWTDHFNNSWKLDFALDKKKLRGQFPKIKRYRPEIAQRHVFVALQRASQKYDPRKARIRLKKLGQSIQIQVDGSSPEIVAEWKKDMEMHRQEAMDQYLYKNYYDHYVSPLGERAVKQNHIRYAMESRESVIPVAQAIYELLPPDSDSRAYTNLLLSWVQSIPYDTIENRFTSNGSGYSPPLDLLNNNRGDCDSKTVLTASLMRALIPQLSVGLIFLPQHALLGINLPHRNNEDTLKEDDIEYLLLEPTGPAPLRIGQLAPSSKNFVDNGMYTVEALPALKRSDVQQTQ